jgi:hypothetical protein
MKSFAALVASLCLLTGSTAFAVDTQAPQVMSISISPDPVDISAGTQTLTATVRVTDDDSGLSYGSLYLYNPNNLYVRAGSFSNLQRTSGTDLDGIYVCTVEVPVYAVPGVWRMEAVVSDVALNERFYSPTETAFPVPADALLTVVNAGTIDGGQPVLAEFSVAPDPVASGPAAVPVTLAMRITDVTAGFRYGFAYLYDPEGNYQPGLSPNFDTGIRVSGNDLDGMYELPITLPQGSSGGTWQVGIYLVDAVGNAGYVVAGSFVVDDTGSPSFPLARALDAAEYTWTSGSPAWTAQTVETNDTIDAAASGLTEDGGQSSFQTTVTGPGTLNFWWKVDSEEDADYLSARVDGTAEIREISGDSGWVQESLPIPAGESTVIFRYEKNASISAGEDRGWVDQVRFTADTDTDLPVLQSLEITPDPVDISGGPQTVTFTLEVSDDFFGASGGTLNLFDTEEGEPVELVFDVNDRISGNAGFGTFQFTHEFAGNTNPGTWFVEATLVEEVSLNTRDYGAAADPFPSPGEQFFVITDGAPGDTEAPLVADISVSPGTVDVTGSGAAIAVSVRIIDQGSGVRDGNISVYTPDGNWTGSTYFQSGNRISGTPMDGVYLVTVPVAAYGPAGIWRVGCSITDEAGNEREYPYEAPFQLPGNEYFQVENSGAEDLVAPLVSSISITPPVLDASAGPGSITVNVTLQDNLSGIRDAYLFFYDPAGEYDPALFAAFDGTNRISGDAVSGTYQVTVTVPPGTTPGQWSARLFLRDFVGWTVFYDGVGTPYPEAGDGLFTVGSVPAAVYDAFTTLHGLTGNDALRSSDPDHDGVNNATEFLLGSDPDDAADTGAGLITADKDETHFHLSFTLDPALSVAVNGDFLELGGGAGPFRVTGQIQSGGLTGTWTNVPPVHFSGSTYRVSLPLAGGAKGFARLFFPEP